MTVYLDACCLSRLTDDQSQARIREEAESIHRVFLYLALATVEIDDEVAHRAQSLVGLGYGPFDALHIAAAESAGVDPVSWSKEQRIMNAINQLTDEQFERQALDLLLRELGADGLARFLRLNRSGAGDYTRDREELHKGLTLDQILQSIRDHRELQRQ